MSFLENEQRRDPDPHGQYFTDETFTTRAITRLMRGFTSLVSSQTQAIVALVSSQRPGGHDSDNGWSAAG